MTALDIMNARIVLRVREIMECAANLHIRGLAHASAALCFSMGVSALGLLTSSQSAASKLRMLELRRGGAVHM